MSDETLYSKRTNWKELGIRIRVSIGCAVFSIFCGFLLTFLSFFMSNDHTVDNSVLFVLGESLVFTGSILGVSIHVNEEEKRLREDISKYIDKINVRK